MLIAARTETAPRLAAAGWVRMVPGIVRRGAVLAAEPAGATYDTAPPAAVPASRTAGWLDEIGAIADQRNRDMGRLVALLATATQADDLAQLCGGMSLQVWLEHTCRCTRREAREVLGAAETLRHLPATLAGLADGWLSWSQAAAIGKAARTVRVRLLVELDRLVSEAMVAHRDWEPDALVADVWDWTDRHQPSRLEKDEAAAGRDRVATLSPRLFGGGTLFADLDTIGFATVAEALHAPMDPPPAVPDDLSDDDAGAEVFDTLDERRRALTRQHGRALADRLIGLCERDLAGTPGDTGTAGGDGSDRHTGDGEAGGDSDDGDSESRGVEGGVRRRARPLLLATLGLDALLDDTRTPGWLLHTLAGGRMKISATALQRLVDARGADLRTVVLDEVGQVVGVGQRTAVPPGWLREAIWARDTAVSDPDGTCPVRRADLDHIDPWPDGPTDVDNLHPLGRRFHNHKTSRHWTVERARDGTTTWRHRRHGWQIRLAPPRRDLTNLPDPGPPRPPPPALPLDGPDPPPD